ncbi:MAG: ABC transporter substrate-binding protein [Gammaproteobacteria bacterium]|nr:ABC transporter substrate-binding protein [Gammaproteobacteria bacterium]
MRILATLALLLCSLSSLATPDPRTPDQIVQQTADTLAARIEGRQKQLEANPPELYKLVDEVFLPVFDTDYAGRLVLGKHWRTATPAQREQFIDTFYDFLLRSYSRYVLRFEKDKVRILPAQVAAGDAKRAVVKTEMQLEDGKKVPVHYSLHQTKDGWRAYDVRIEGISYVQNYRNQFNAEIGAKGIEAVITRLKTDAARVTTKPVGGGST